MSREHILHKVRTALGRSAGQDAGCSRRQCGCAFRKSIAGARGQPAARQVEALAGKTQRCVVARRLRVCRGAGGGPVRGGFQCAVAGASAASLRCRACAPGVTDREELRELCATADVGITRRRLTRWPIPARW